MSKKKRNKAGGPAQPGKTTSKRPGRLAWLWLIIILVAAASVVFINSSFSLLLLFRLSGKKKVSASQMSC